MKTLEYNSRYEWLDTVLNLWPLCIDQQCILSIGFAWDEEGFYKTGLGSQFYNGFAFVRFTFPFGIWLHLKPLRNLRFQCGVGYKLNGRAAVTFRFQTDASAAAGVSGANFGQASGWARGTA